MADTNRDRDAGPELRYDNWPLAEHGKYADWDVERVAADEYDGATETTGEARVEDVEWIGFVGGHDPGHPLLYSPQDAALYEGELDEEHERVRLRDAKRHDVDEDSLSDHLKAIGDDHGWDWLSSFARTHLDDETAAKPALEHRTSEFHQRNVVESADHDLAFYGSHTFADDSGQIHIIERYFTVSPDAGSNDTRVAVDEEYLRAEEPAEQRREGDAEIVAQNERALDISVDTADAGGDQALAGDLENWHMAHAGWPRKT